MKSVLRTILAVVAGMVLVLGLVIAVELWSSVVHPTPPGFQGTMDEMCQHVARYPHWVLGVVVIFWSAIAFAGTWVASRIGDRAGGIILTLLLTWGIVCNLAMLPYPIWFKVVMLCCFAVACFLGYRKGVRPPLTRAEESQPA